MNKKTPYFKLLFQSFKDFFIHLRVVVPTLILGMSLTGIVFLFIIQMIILKMINGSLILTSYVVPVGVSNFILAGLFLVLNILLFVIIRTYTGGMELGIIRGIITSQKLTWAETKSSGKRYFSNLFKYYCLNYLLWTIGIVFVWIMVGMELSEKMQTMVNVGITIIGLIIGLLFFYLQPIIALEKKTFFYMLKHSCCFFRKHPLKTIFPMIIIGIISIGLGYSLALILAPFQRQLLHVMQPFIILMYGAYHLLNIIYRVFIFRCYHFNKESQSI